MAADPSTPAGLAQRRREAARSFDALADLYAAWARDTDPGDPARARMLLQEIEQRDKARRLEEPPVEAP